MKKLIFAFVALFSFESQAAVYSGADALGLPKCNDERLMEGVLATIKAYQEEHPATSIYEKRHRALILRDLNNFREVSSEGFNSKNNFFVANRIIMTKVNNNLTNQDLRLCQSVSKGLASSLYLLVYEKDYTAKVEIINFAPEVEDFGFNY